MENYNRFSKPEATKTDDINGDITPAYLHTEAETEEKTDTLGKIINCVNLNIRLKPEFDADVIDTVPCSTKVIITDGDSTDEFYKIHTTAGIDGFCMKQFISIDE